MQYYITLEDLQKGFDFSVKFFLEKSTTANRITGYYRGLGGIFDSFIIGKIIEIAVASVIRTDHKEVVLDFNIHEINRENRSDPDIIKVLENGKERDPNIYVEIKVVSSGDRWVGLTAEQFNTIMENKIVGDDLSKVYLIYSTLESLNQDKDSDLLGARALLVIFN